MAKLTITIDTDTSAFQYDDEYDPYSEMQEVVRILEGLVTRFKDDCVVDERSVYDLNGGKVGQVTFR